MDRINTHPSAEKLQIKFQNQNTNQNAGKETKSTKTADFSDLKDGFNIRDEFTDVEREFEIQYEQFLSNISGKAARRAQRE
jgi:lipopolysaccharide export LptBFGC system permease protein LptF